MRKILSSFIVALSFVVTAHAQQTIEIRNGDGAALQVAMATAPTGTTILVYNGTYVTTNNGGDPSENGGFAVGHDGVTIKAAPGETPLLANCPLAQSNYCPRPTITALGRENVVVDGFKIHGGVWLTGKSVTPGQGSRGVVFKNNEVDTGWGEVNDGNWAAFFIDGQDGAQFLNNYIHDVFVPTGGGAQDSGSAFKLYYNSNVQIISNTVQRVNISTSQVGGVDEKAHGHNLVVRGNWIEGVQTGMRLNSQSAAVAIQGALVEGNVFIAASGSARPCLRVTQFVETSTFRNNTCVGFTQAVLTESGPAKVAFYNNIFTNMRTGGRNVEAYTPVFQAPTDYNVWAPGGNFTYPGRPTGQLSVWQTSGFDTHSLAIACSFTATEWKLAGGACTTAGRVGGVSTGATIEAGAYGAVTCVGNACGTTPPPPQCTYSTAPSAVTVPAAGGQAPISMVTGAACVWPITTDVPWLRLSSTENIGPGQVTVSADANTNTTSRTGTVIAGGQATVYTQSGATTPPPSSYSYTACVTISNNQVTTIVPGACAP